MITVIIEVLATAVLCHGPTEEKRARNSIQMERVIMAQFHAKPIHSWRITESIDAQKSLRFAINTRLQFRFFFSTLTIWHVHEIFV